MRTDRIGLPCCGVTPGGDPEPDGELERDDSDGDPGGQVLKKISAPIISER
jgi:hypothetical protein